MIDQVQINNCHRIQTYSNDNLLFYLSTLMELISTSLPDTVANIADKLANKTPEQHHAIE